MESTASDPLVVSSQCLRHAFDDLPDPRRAGSVRYPVAAILTMTVSALLANHHSVLAIAEWSARQDQGQLEELGFVDGTTPCQSTLQRLFCKLDGASLAQHLTHWFQRVSAPIDDQARQGVAIDGKAQRGRLVFTADGLVHALSAFCHETGLVVGQVPITVTTTKADAELTVAPLLLAQIDWHGRVLTGDALFCQRALSAGAGGRWRLSADHQGQPARTAHRDPRVFRSAPSPGGIPAR